jgi:ribosomal protein S27AE
MTELKTKRCPKCGVAKAVSEFGRRGKYWKSWCRGCRNKCDKERYARCPEVRAQKSATDKRRYANPEVRARKSAIGKRRYANPEVRVRQRAAAKRRYAEVKESPVLLKRRHEQNNTSNRKWCAENSEKCSAQRKVRDAVKTGEVVKPSFCSSCGKRRVLNGHHDDYAHPLDVRWLCNSCHGKEHRKY